MTANDPHDSDDEWAARVTRAVRSGSRDALAEIYDRCADDIVRSLRHTTRRDESFALDCLQEMFMRLAARPPIVDSHAALVAWMRLAALNVARNLIVSDHRRARRESSARPTASDSATDTDSIDSILKQLDAEELALLRLRHVEGMRVKAIARAFGATPRAIESALRRLASRLRDGGAS
ncbi:MAG: hypothetical protein RL354_13 [Planctomycetota bacterium]